VGDPPAERGAFGGLWNGVQGPVAPGGFFRSMFDFDDFLLDFRLLFAYIWSERNAAWRS
jgi:hypothetical protein